MYREMLMMSFATQNHAILFFQSFQGNFFMPEGS
jgi:hypothetical protein